MAIVAVLLLVCAVVTGLALSGVLKFGAKSDARALQARGTAPTGVLEARGAAPSPVMPRVDERLVMPKDVREWLEHLKRCEDQKRQIDADEVPRFTALVSQVMLPLGSVQDVLDMSSPDTNLDKVPHSDAIGEATRRVVTRWTDLYDYFWRYKPPVECQALADSFGTGLDGASRSFDKIGRLMTSINPMAENAQNNIQESVRELQHFRSTHKQEVDDKFKLANEQLNEICAKYGEKPWFSIDDKGSVGGLLGGVN
jgi:hypothetical protein